MEMKLVKFNFWPNFVPKVKVLWFKYKEQKNVFRMYQILPF